MTPVRAVLLDNETLGVGPDAVLLSAAAVAVEIRAGHVTHLGHWYRRLHHFPAGSAQPGRQVDRDTLRWWFQQDAEPFMEALSNPRQRLPLPLAADSLHAWLQLNPYPIWGNGSDFDNAQWQHAFHQHGYRWPYWRNRCLRSLKGVALDLQPDTPLPDFPAGGIKHHALHDALHEAEILAALLHALQRRPQHAPTPP